MTFNGKFTNELEKQINLSLMVMNTKINALRSLLSKEQEQAYFNSIKELETNFEKLLQEDILTQKEFDELIEVLHT